MGLPRRSLHSCFEAAIDVAIPIVFLSRILSDDRQFVIEEPVADVSQFVINRIVQR
ncbi:MAG: hypothetical protein F6K28_30050, partial [Microcoleus sp. SIO2G3]|nr:hypothetical protein [Microcoleus sp. SIO2G3]